MDSQNFSTKVAANINNSLANLPTAFKVKELFLELCDLVGSRVCFSLGSSLSILSAEAPIVPAKFRGASPAKLSAYGIRYKLIGDSEM